LELGVLEGEERVAALAALVIETYGLRYLTQSFRVKYSKMRYELRYSAR
jgi:hypothetical protein